MLIHILGAAIAGVLVSQVALMTAQRMLLNYACTWLPGKLYRTGLTLFFATFFVVTALQNHNIRAFTLTVAFMTILVTLALIDLQIKILPNLITIPLLVSGLLLSLSGLHITFGDSVVGMVFGYLILLVPHLIYKLITSKDGVGFGDIKLMAGIGAWIGWQSLIQITLIASISAALVGYLLVSLNKQDKKDYLAFGPYLVGATLITLLLNHPFQ